MKFLTSEVKDVILNTTAIAGTVFPVYELAKISIGENVLRSRCINSNIMYQRKLGKGVPSHTYYINAKLLRGVIQRVSSEEIEFILGDAALTIKHSGGIYSLPSNNSIQGSNALDRKFDYSEGEPLDLTDMRLIYEVHKHSIPDDKSYLARVVYSGNNRVYSSDGISLTVSDTPVTSTPVSLSVDTLKALISIAEADAKYTVYNDKVAIWGEHFMLLQGDTVGVNSLETAEEVVLEPVRDSMEYICEVGIADFIQAADMMELFVKASIQHEVFITYDGDAMLVANKEAKPTAVQRVGAVDIAKYASSVSHRLNVRVLKEALKCIPYDTVKVYKASRVFESEGESMTQPMTFLVFGDVKMILMEITVG